MIKKYKNIKRNYSEKAPDWKEMVVGFSDEQLIDVLKKRDHYQKEMAELAIAEALKRELIYSEQDLMGEEFRNVELQFSWFPKIVKEQARAKVRKSIARSLVLCGIIPTIFGLLEMNRSAAIDGKLIAGFGFLWIFLAARLMKTNEPGINTALMIGNGIGLGYAIWRVMQLKGAPFMDFAVPVILTGMVFYGLAYLRRLK